MRFALAAALATIAASLVPASAAEEGRWLKARDAQRIAKEREERGEIPVAIECRHDPEESGALVKPQVRVRWEPNPERLIWRFKVTGRSRANDLLRAAYRQQGFALVARDTFSTGATDQEWMCELWHKTR